MPEGSAEFDYAADLRPGQMILVVGAAIVRHGTVLAARRTTPPEVAGRWELPGGKVDPGESPEDAVVREIDEELGCRVSVEGWLDGEQPIGTTHVLRAAVCGLAAGDPAAGADHDELRWLTPEQLDDLDWLEPDRPFLAQLREILRAVVPPQRPERRLPATGRTVGGPS